MQIKSFRTTLYFLVSRRNIGLKTSKHEFTDRSHQNKQVFDAILTSWQTSKKLQCLDENLMSNNFRKAAVVKKKMTSKLKLQNKGLY